MFPRRTPIEHTPEESAEVELSADAPTDVLGVASSETAQSLLTALGREPATASELADAVDTSVQNAQYHLERLAETDLVEPVDTWYSSRGTPMTVYGLASKRLVVEFAAGDDRTEEPDSPAPATPTR